MSKNIIELTQLENGDFEFNFHNKDMDNIIIHDWLKSDFSCRNLLAAAALCCTSGSMLYELDVRKPGAKYKDLKSFVTWRTGKDEKGRIIIESLNVKVQVDVPEEHLGVQGGPKGARGQHVLHGTQFKQRNQDRDRDNKNLAHP